ncbi:MAG: hypothetical protein ACPGU4_10385, partial [Flavobacteriales bacterium]
MRRLINTVLIVSLLISFSSISFQAVAQDKGLDITGSVREGMRGLEGTKLTLIKNGSVDETFVTTSNGKFKFFFDVNATYMLDISKPGYVGKKISFNTEVPAEFMSVWDFDFIVELFKDQSGLNKAIFSNPVAKIQYSRRHNEFDYDLDYTMEFQKQEEEVFAELEKLNEEKYLEEERLRKEAEKLAKSQAKELAAAEKAKAAAEKAKLAEEAKQKKAAEAEAKRLAEEARAKAETEERAESERLAAEEEKKKAAELAQAKLEEEKREAELAAEKAKKTEYADLVKEAEALSKAGSYTEAKAKFEQASRVFPDKFDLSDKIGAMETQIAKAKAEAEQREKKDKQFNDLMAQANELAELKKYDPAIKMFETAADVNPDSEFPGQRIAEMKAAIAAIAKAEQDKKTAEADYKRLMKEARAAESDQDYGKAKDMFAEASQLKPGESEPGIRIAAIEEILERLTRERREADERNKKINALLDEGIALQKAGNLEGAQGKYQGALDLDAENEEAIERLAEVAEILNAAQAEKELLAKKENDFAEFLSEGGSLQSASNFAEAKSKYEAALALGFDDGAAQKRIDDVNVLLEKQQAGLKAQQELAAKFQAKYDKGAELLSEDKFELAIAQFQEASALMPENPEPNNRIAEINAKILAAQKKKEEEEKRNAELAGLLASGKDRFKQKDYSSALEAFRQLQELDPENKEASLRLKQIEEILAKQEEERIAAEELAKKQEKERLKAEAEEAARLEEERLAEAARVKAEEEKRAAEELAKRQEEERLKAEAEEAARIEEERLAEEARVKAEEEKRAAEELAKLEEEERLKAEAEEAARVEADRLAQEARIKKEEEKEAKRLAKEAAKEAEAAEKARLAEVAQKEKEEQEALLAQQKAEEEKRAAEELAKQQEEERLKIEESARLEEERLAEEARAKAEEEKRAAEELANKEEEERLKAEAEEAARAE